MKQILYIIFGLSVGAMVIFAIAFALEINTAINTIEQGQTFYAGLLSAEYRPHSTQSALCINQPTTELELESKLDLELEPELEPEQEPEQELKLKPKLKPKLELEPEPFIDFGAAQEVFPDIVAWIKCEDTAINYPLVQGENNDFYLSRLPDRSSNAMGSIFLDYRNTGDFSDQSIIIYGHNMPTGDMFGSLKHYKDPDYYVQHNSMLIFTPHQDYRLILFAGYIIDSVNETLPMNFIDHEDFGQYISDIRSRSIFSSDIEVSFKDRFVFLVTCTPSGSINDRLVIAGKLY